MVRHIARRLLLAIPTLLAVFTIIFIIVRIAPGDPAIAVLGDYASAEAVEALREKMGLNVPIWQQYLNFLGDLARGDLGNSMISQKPVSEQIAFVLGHELAHHYLGETEVELKQAAYLLGYAVANSFFRAFQAWEGTTPGDWRTQHQQVRRQPMRSK